MADFTQKETLAAIQLAASSKGDGKFRIRVMRRKAGGGLEALAIFENGKSEHVITPEMWLGDLAGGGLYFLGIFHADEAATQIGGMIEHNVDGQTHDPTWSVITSGDWRGPVTLSWPDPSKIRPAGSNGNGREVSVGSRAGRRSYGFGDAEGTPIQTRSYGDADNPVVVGLERQQARERELIQRQAAMDVESIRRELEADKRQLEQRVSDLTSKISALTEKISERPAPRTDAMESIKGLAGPIMEAVKLIFTTMSDGNKARVDAQLASEIAARQLQVDLHKMQLEQNKEANARLEKLIELLAKKEPDDGREKAMFSTMTEAVGKMASTTMSLLASAAEMREATAPPQESGPSVREIILELAKSIGKFVPAQQQQQLPPPPQQPRQAAPQGQQPQQQPPQRPPPQLSPDSSLERLELMVKQRADPAAIAEAFFDEYDRNNGFEKLVTEAPDAESTQASLIGIFGPRLETWFRSNPVEHGAYLATIGEAIDTFAKRSGRMPPEQPAPTQPPAQG